MTRMVAPGHRHRLINSRRVPECACGPPAERIGPGPGPAELDGSRRVVLIIPQSPWDNLARDDLSSFLVKLRRRGLALALVSDLRDHRAPVSEEDLADFETDALAGFVLARLGGAGRQHDPQ